jgi:hypothetical protein
LLSIVDDIPMSRIVRHLLFASVLTCHAVVTLCGPCLHALPGSTHEPGVVAKTDRPGDPLLPSRHTTDNCLLCQFIAQGQLPFEASIGITILPTAESAFLAVPTSDPIPTHLPSGPRAPPVIFAGLS